MIPVEKTNVALGTEVEQVFAAANCATPKKENKFTSAEKIEIIADHMAEILTTLGMDLDDPSLRETPRRVAKMYVNEVFSGLSTANAPKCTAHPNHYKGMVVVRDIELHSMCEHHLMPMLGKVTIAYIPDQLEVGLSKFNRIVNYCARRPQVQERLTTQIMEMVKHVTQSENVAVVVDAEHFCVKARGVQDACSDTGTHLLSGEFMTDPSVRAEFFARVKG